MPGAPGRRSVAISETEVRSTATPSSTSPSSRASSEPRVGSSASEGTVVQYERGGSPDPNGEITTASAPNTPSHSAKLVRFGIAIFREPIINGTT